MNLETLRRYRLRGYLAVALIVSTVLPANLVYAGYSGTVPIDSSTGKAPPQLIPAPGGEVTGTLTDMKIKTSIRTRTDMRADTTTPGFTKPGTTGVQPVSTGTSTSAGTSTDYSPIDHKHVLPTTLTNAVTSTGLDIDYLLRASAVRGARASIVRDNGEVVSIGATTGTDTTTETNLSALFNLGRRAQRTNAYGLAIGPEISGGAFDRALVVSPITAVAPSGNLILEYAYPTVTSGVTGSLNARGIWLGDALKVSGLDAVDYALAGSLVSSYQRLVISLDAGAATNNAGIAIGGDAVPAGNWGIYDYAGFPSRLSGPLGVGKTAGTSTSTTTASSSAVGLDVAGSLVLSGSAAISGNAVVGGNTVLGGDLTRRQVSTHPPQTVGAAYSGAGALAVEVSADRLLAFVLNYTDGTVQAFDISTGTPVAVGSPLSVGTNPRAMSLAGNFLVIVSGDNKLRVVDVSVPGALAVKGIVNVVASPQAVRVDGKRAYVVSDVGNKFQTIDYTDPVHPVSVASVSIGAGGVGIDIYGGFAFVSEYSTHAVQAVDIRDPYNPVVKPAVTVGGSPWGVAATSRYILVANSGGYLSVLDGADPSNLSVVTTLIVGSNGGRAIDVAGKYAYVADFTGSRIYVVDWSTPSVPAVIGYVPVETNPYWIRVVGKTAWIAAFGSGKVQSVDVRGASLNALDVDSLYAGRASVGKDLIVGGQGIFGGSVIADGTVGGSNIREAPAAYGTPKANASGKIDDGWLSTSVVLATSTLISTSTNAVTSTGLTAGKLPKAKGARELDDSIISQTTDGKLGINTTLPLGMLDVSSGSASPATMAIDSAPSSYAAGAELGRLQIGSVNDGNLIPAVAIAGLNTLNNDSARGELTFLTRYSGVLSERLRVTATGKIGIDNQAPPYMLTLGTAGISDGALALAGRQAGYVVHMASANTDGYTVYWPPSKVDGYVKNVDGQLSFAVPTPAEIGAAPATDTRFGIATNFGIAISTVATQTWGGVSTNASREDHQHGHGAQPLGDGSNHAAVSASYNGFATPAMLAASTNATTSTGLTAGYHVKASGTRALVNSLVYDNGTNVGVNTNNPHSTFELNSGSTSPPILDVYSTVASFSAGMETGRIQFGTIGGGNDIPSAAIIGKSSLLNDSSRGALVFSPRYGGVLTERLRLEGTSITASGDLYVTGAGTFTGAITASNISTTQGTNRIPNSGADGNLDEWISYSPYVVTANPDLSTGYIPQALGARGLTNSPLYMSGNAMYTTNSAQTTAAAYKIAAANATGVLSGEWFPWYGSTPTGVGSGAGAAGSSGWVARGDHRHSAFVDHEWTQALPLDASTPLLPYASSGDGSLLWAWPTRYASIGAAGSAATYEIELAVQVTGTCGSDYTYLQLQVGSSTIYVAGTAVLTAGFYTNSNQTWSTSGTFTIPAGAVTFAQIWGRHDVAGCTVNLRSVHVRFRA